MPSYVAHGGAIYSRQPSVSPRYQLPYSPNRTDTMARIGVFNADDPRQTYTGNFDLYKNAIAGNGYIDFFLQSVVESVSEKYQVAEVLGDSYASYFFGQHAPQFTFTGALLNTKENRWRAGMHYLYKDLLRGSELARRGLIARVQYDSVLVEGALTSFVESMNANDETTVQFSFQLLVKQFIELDPPETASVSVTRAFDQIEYVTLQSEKDADTLSPTVVEEQETPVQDANDLVVTGQVSGGMLRYTTIDLLNDGW